MTKKKPTIDKKLRDFCRKELERCFSEQEITEHFCSNVTNKLLKKRIIEEIKKSKDEYKYHLTQQGRRLAAKNLLRRLTKAEAKERISEIIKRARTINADSTLLYGIRKITLFGSCLKMMETVGDIDLAVAIQQKSNWTIEAHDKLAQAWSQKTRLAPFNWSGEGEIRKMLKARDPYISIVTDLLFQEKDFHPRMIIYQHNRNAFRKFKKPELSVICAFCGETGGGRTLIAAPRMLRRGSHKWRNEFKQVAICSSCVDVCVATIERAKKKKQPVKKSPDTKGNGNGLNSIGKPYSESFDPNYRMKHRTSLAHLYKPQNINGISPERWTELCAMAKAHWDFSREHGTPLPMHTDAPVPQVTS
jgi:predicted nucleotidyltransferase